MTVLHHIQLRCPEDKLFVEMYAEYLRAQHDLSKGPGDLILWWNPDRPYLRTRSNPNLVQSADSDTTYWQDLREGLRLEIQKPRPFGLPDSVPSLSPSPFTSVMVVDNDLLFDGGVRQVRNAINQILVDISKGPADLDVILLSHAKISAASYMQQVDHYLVTHNSQTALFTKDRNGHFGKLITFREWESGKINAFRSKHSPGSSPQNWFQP